MGGFLGALKESGLGKEVSVPICSFPMRKGIHVFYTYYIGKPRSHRLEFRKGKRTTFEMFLSNYGENISQLCSIIDDQEYRRAGGKASLGFWSRLALRFSVGTFISCRDIFSGPSSGFHSRIGEARLAYRYRFVYCRKGAQESIVLISSRQSSECSPYRKEQDTEVNWLKLRLSEFRELLGNLRLFMGSKEFSEITGLSGAGLSGV